MSLDVGDQVELKVTPDAYVTVRYAGASGDFNPIHIDEEFAQGVGLPGRILHGLWSMAQVARALTEEAGTPVTPEGDGYTLTSLGVQFRGMGRIGEEIVVAGAVDAVADGVASVALEAVQGDTRLIRNARATLRSN
jgi:acyl dehydratase